MVSHVRKFSLCKWILLLMKGYVDYTVTYYPVTKRGASAAEFSAAEDLASNYSARTSPS